jgi:hypothetical protein
VQQHSTAVFFLFFFFFIWITVSSSSSGSQFDGSSDFNFKDILVKGILAELAEITNFQLTILHKLRPPITNA